MSDNVDLDIVAVDEQGLDMATMFLEKLRQEPDAHTKTLRLQFINTSMGLKSSVVVLMVDDSEESREALRILQAAKVKFESSPIDDEWRQNISPPVAPVVITLAGGIKGLDRIRLFYGTFRLV